MIVDVWDFAWNTSTPPLNTSVCEGVMHWTNLVFVFISKFIHLVIRVSSKFSCIVVYSYYTNRSIFCVSFIFKCPFFMYFRVPVYLAKPYFIYFCVLKYTNNNTRYTKHEDFVYRV